MLTVITQNFGASKTVYIMNYKRMTETIPVMNRHLSKLGEEGKQLRNQMTAAGSGRAEH